jgi:hypothetical protein
MKNLLSLLCLFIIFSCADSQIAGGATDTETGPPIAGTIRDIQNKALARVQVRLYPLNQTEWDTTQYLSTWTDSNGHFSITQPHKKAAKIVVIHNQTGITSNTRSDSSTYDLQLKALCRVKFYTLNPNLKSIRLIGTAVQKNISTVQENEKYSFYLDNIPEGNYSIQVKNSDSALATDPTLVVNADSVNIHFLDNAAESYPIPLLINVSRDDIIRLGGHTQTVNNINLMINQIHQVFMNNRLVVNSKVITLWHTVVKIDTTYQSVTTFSRVYNPSYGAQIVLDPQNLLGNGAWSSQNQIIRLNQIGDKVTFWQNNKPIELAQMLIKSLGGFDHSQEIVSSNYINAVLFQPESSLTAFADSSQRIDSLNLRILAQTYMKKSDSLYRLSFIPSHLKIMALDSLEKPLANQSFVIYAVNGKSLYGAPIDTILSNNTGLLDITNSPYFSKNSLSTQNIMISPVNNVKKAVWLPISQIWMRTPADSIYSAQKIFK